MIRRSWPTAPSSYKYVSKETGKKNPTLLLFSNDSKSGKRAVKFQSVA